MYSIWYWIRWRRLPTHIFLILAVSSNIRIEDVWSDNLCQLQIGVKKPSLLYCRNEILKDVKKLSKKNISPDHIINTCSDFYSIRKDDILSSTIGKKRDCSS